MGRLAPITLLPIVVRHWMTVLSKVSDSDIDIKGGGDLKYKKKEKRGERRKKGGEKEEREKHYTIFARAHMTH